LAAAGTTAADIRQILEDLELGESVKVSAES
jgi:hypothetical protein